MTNCFKVKEVQRYPFGKAVYIAPPEKRYEFTFYVGESMNKGTLCFPFESDVFRIPIKGTMNITRRNGEQYTGYIAADDDSYIIVPVDTAPTYRKK